MADTARSRAFSAVGPRFLIAPLLLLALAAPARAEPDADRLATQRLDWLTQLARRDAAEWEADLISAPREAGPTVGNLRDPGAVLRELRPALAGDYEAVRNRLTALDAKARARREAVQKEWAEVYRQRVAFRRSAEARQAAYGFDFESGALPVFRPNVIDAALLGWAAVALLVALRLRATENRLERRKARRAVAAGLILVLTLLPGCDLPGTDARPWAAREGAELTAALRSANEAANAAEAVADRKWRAATDARARLVAAPSETADDLVRREEADVRDRLRRVTQEARLADRLARDVEEQRDKLADEKARLDALAAGAGWRSVAAAGARVAVALALLGVCVAPLWRAVKRNRALVRRATRQCPRCFKLDTLRAERRAAPDDGDDDPTPNRLRGQKPVAPRRKTATGYVECANCGLRLRLSYLKVPRLCFPAVGVPGSGKTHMLATAYNAVQKGVAPTAAAVQQAPSLGDQRFDQYIELIVEGRGTAGGTVHALPDPIMVHVRDTDRAGRNTALVNLFDYSGELLNDKIDVSDLRKTAVRMDGFMLFLDPTQLYGGDGRVTLKAKLAKLKEFLTDMRDERGVPVGTVIPVPVAVCIPKFDLLLTQNPIGGQAVHFTRHLLEHLYPPPRGTTLDVVAARSELVEQMLPLLFPGVDVRGIVEGYFGKQVMFFPMTAVNLIESELGVADLGKRSAIVPFGVAEPVVWLLHMHGYEVFARDRRE